MATTSRKSVLIVAEWADPRLQHGIARYARQAKWHLNLDSVYSNELPWGWRGDGCIAMVGRPDILRFTKSLRVPVVDVTHQTASAFPRIHEDDQAIGTLAAQYLLSHGFKHFACCRTDLLDVSTVRQRSFAEAIARSGHSTVQLLRDRHDLRGRGDWAHRKRWIAGHLRALPKPAAVFCIDDRVAVSVIDAATECGISIPDEIAVLGVGNLETACECSAVPLSSIRVDYESLGFRAAEMLDRILKGRPPPSAPVLLSPQGIEERHSTSTIAVDDPAGRKALRFMLDRYRTPIRVGDVARAGGLTKRQLTYIVQQDLKSTPALLLETVRLRAARRLLAAGASVKRAAAESGFGSPLRLQRVFRKRHGTTPRLWAKAHRDAPDGSES